MKHEHYILREFNPRIDADISISKQHVNLSIWLGYVNEPKVIFDRNCANKDEALEIMKGFGHGFEYLGVCWEKVQ